MGQPFIAQVNFYIDNSRVSDPDPHGSACFCPARIRIRIRINLQKGKEMNE